MTVSSGPDIEGLKEFLNEPDRSFARFFSGRDAQIDDIETVCRLVSRCWKEKRPGPADGVTRLVQGAPGAGKTSLLRFLTQRWKGQPDMPDVVYMTGSQMTSLDRIYQVMNSAAPAGILERIVKVASPSSASVGVPGVAGTAWNFRPADGPTRARLTRPVCLMIDEVQNVPVDTRPGESGGPLELEVRSLLESLHTGQHELPIVPVLAGLANSQRRLAAAGLSRFAEDAVHTLQPLAQVEAAESVRMFLDRYRVATGSRTDDAWMDRVATASNGWPQHLHNGLRSLARGLIEVDGDLEKVDVAAWREAESGSRKTYYARRVSEELADSIILLGRVVEAISRTPDCNRRMAGEMIATAAQDNRDYGSELPEGMTPAGYLSHMIERGVVQDDGGRISCPIPSLRDYILAEADRS